MSDAQSINVDDFRTAANEMRKAYGHHNAVCAATDLLLRALAKIESDAKVIAALREALSGIAEYCSGDGRPLGAIDRLVAVRNTAERALAAANEQTGGK